MKIYPELGQQESRLYRVWIIARHLDKPGSGKVSIVDLASFISDNDIRGLSSRTLRRLIKKGEGAYWFATREHLYLRGLFRVCLHFGVRKLAHAPVEVEVKDVRTLKGFRAACYSGLFPNKEWSNPISRKTLQGLTNKTGRTQRGYDKLLGKKIEKQENAILTSLPVETGGLPSNYYIDKFVWGGKERLGVFKRLPNSFKVSFPKAARGMMKSVNSQLRYSFRNGGKEKREKIFYRDAKAVSRRIESMKEGSSIVFLGTEVDGVRVKKSRGGATLWTNIQRCNGEIFFS